MTTTSSIIPPPETPDRVPDLVYLGDDGTWLVAYGHVNPHLYAALVVARWAADTGQQCTVSTFGLSGCSERSLDDIARDVCHLWAVDCLYGGDHGVFWVNPDTDEKVTAETPGAFPITMFDTEV